MKSGQSVTAGSFTVSLDFGGGVFTGADRFLEIAVRRNSGESFVALSPRQPITSNPYAIRSANAAAAESLSNLCVLCVTDAQIQSIAGSKVTGTVANATNAATATNVSGIVAIANGGTGSATKNFVDLSTDQTVSGNKTFTGALTVSGAITGNGSGLTNITAQTTSNFSLLGSLRWDLLRSQNFPVGSSPFGVAFDGANIWAANGSNNVTKLRASDGANLGNFAAGSGPDGIAFDGANIWVANRSSNNVTKLPTFP
jgi:hypothetical protein